MTLFGANVYAYAADEPQPAGEVRMSYGGVPSAKCTLQNGKINASAQISGNADDVSSCKATAYLQRRAAGSSAAWTTVATYKATGAASCTASGTYTPSSGYEYRVYGEMTIYGRDGGFQNYKAESNVVKL